MTAAGRLPRDYLPRDLRALLDEAAELIGWAQHLDDQAWPKPPAAVTLALVEKAADVANRVVWSYEERHDEELAADERAALRVVEQPIDDVEPPAPPDHPEQDDDDSDEPPAAS